MASNSFKKEDLLKNVERDNWWRVMEIYERYPESHVVKIDKFGNTAIHRAIYRGLEPIVEGLVWLCQKEALAIRDEWGDTPLHDAAVVGSVRMCRCIAKKDSNLIGSRNDNGETPLFRAMIRGRMNAFRCLLDICREKQHQYYAYDRRKNGDTILHSAILEGHFDIAHHIIKQHPKLVHAVNEDGISPLHLLASRPDSFPSRTHHSGLLPKIVYYCLRVRKAEGPNDDVRFSFSKWLSSCLISLWNFIINRLRVGRRENHQRDEETANNQVGRRENHQQDEETANNQALVSSIVRGRRYRWLRSYYMMITCLQYLSICIFILLMPVSVPMTYIYLIVFKGYGRLRKIKKMHIWSTQVMNELLDGSSEYAYEQRGMHPPESTTTIYEYPEQHLADNCPILPKFATTKMETPLLIAAKKGVVEMVEGIIDVYPDAIFDVNNEKKNIVMLVVEKRHLYLYMSLLEDQNLWKTLIEQVDMDGNNVFEQVDMDGNNVLHIAATMPLRQPWRIRGAALQMHMEARWYKLVKRTTPPSLSVRKHPGGQTPGEIFRDTHKELIKEGRESLTRNSQSCSVVAALIATIAFATSATVPGGLRQDNGTPTLENQPIFIISAVASVIALCFSMISIIMFLGILTSSFQLEDFRKGLPTKLLGGSITLLFSIVSMLVSFFAGHHFVLKQELKHRATLVYALVCLPLLLFIIAKFPLDFEIMWPKPRRIPQFDKQFFSRFFRFY